MRLLGPCQRKGDVRPVRPELIRGRLPECLPPRVELQFDGHDLGAVIGAYETAKATKGRPVAWEEVQGVDAAKDELKVRPGVSHARV